MAPALSMIVSDAILMTVHRACHAERGAEPGCLGQPAYHGLYRARRRVSAVAGPLVRAARAGKRVSGPVSGVLGRRRQRCRRTSPPAGVASKRGGRGRFDDSHEVLA